MVEFKLFRSESVRWIASMCVTSDSPPRPPAPTSAHQRGQRMKSVKSYCCLCGRGQSKLLFSVQMKQLPEKKSNCF